MSRLAEFRKLEQELAAQIAELESMKQSSGLKKEMEFEDKLRALLAEYGFNLRNVINILDPQSRRQSQAPATEKKSRKPREVKIYKNPHTGETVETKGGNHALLKAWKAEHGAETVESWRAQ